MPQEDVKTTISSKSKNISRRRRFIPLFVAAILFICVAQLEEFNVGWKELTSSQKPTGKTYIRSNTTTKDWKEMENSQQQQQKQQQQREESKSLRSNFANTSTGSWQPGESNQPPAEFTSIGGLNSTNTSTTVTEPVESIPPTAKVTNVTNVTVSTHSGEEELASNQQQQQQQILEVNSTNGGLNSTNVTESPNEWDSDREELGKTNHTVNNTTEILNVTNATVGVNIEGNQPPESITSNVSSTNTSSAEGSADDTNHGTTTRLQSPEEMLLHKQICSKIPPGMSATKIWQLGLPIIEQGLQHPMDVDFTHKFWSRALLELLQPFLLKGSVRAQPSWQLVFPMLVKLAKYLEDPERNPSLKIVVMGGSIAEGVQCRIPPLGAEELPFRTLQVCSWPNRLNILLNHVIQTVWNTTSLPVDIKNIATGGTNTAAATPVVQYWLNGHFQSSAGRRVSSTLDMIINGYAANDNIPDGKDEVDDVNTTISNFHYFSKLEYAMNFAREVANMNAPPVEVNDTSCHAYPRNPKSDPPDPLPLFLNDYYGNLQLSVVGEGQRDEAVQWLSDMHDHTGYVSPPHAAILRWIWANTDDEIFTGAWMKMNKTSVNVHYGMAGHVTDAIFIAYYMLQLALDVCEQVAMSPNPPTTSAINTSEAEVTSAADSFTNSHAVDEYLAIDAEAVSIQEASWTTFSTTSHTCESSPDSPTPLHAPCVFGFLTAAMGSHKTVESTNVYLKPFTKEQRGWNVENDFRYGGFQNKMGLVANETDATMVLATREDKPLQQQIKFVTVYYLKSYGEDWEGSTVRFDVEVNGPPSDRRDPSSAPLLHTQSFTLEGFHDQELSTTYIFKQELGVAVPVGGSMQLTMTLVGGKQFKIIAIMWCNK